ncbi:MAG: S41 family peptidase [Bacillota bacterium]|nr:S41 family peptidase [Bacillota bacterium]
MFLDVIEDGPAHRAGIRPGELLAAVDGDPMIPPAQPRFHIGGAHRLDVIGLDRAPRSVTVEVPNRRAKDRPPMVEPRSITHRMIAPSVGYLKVASFPGAVGMGFAQSLDAAIVDLKQHGCQRLIIDLRGNVGGGLGSLRLMSYLCPGKLPIGYSLTRKRLRNGFEKEKLVRINRIPAGKGDLLLMALRFKIIHRDRSMVLETERLRTATFSWPHCNTGAWFDPLRCSHLLLVLPRLNQRYPVRSFSSTEMCGSLGPPMSGLMPTFCSGCLR